MSRTDYIADHVSPRARSCRHCGREFDLSTFYRYDPCSGICHLQKGKFDRIRCYRGGFR